MLLDNRYCRGLMNGELKDVQGQTRKSIVLASTKWEKTKTKYLLHMDNTLKSNHHDLFFILKLI